MSSVLQPIDLLVTTAKLFSNVDKFDAALSLVNLSRQGSGTPEMTPQQGLVCLQQMQAERSEESNTDDRAQEMIDSVYFKYIKELNAAYQPKSAATVSPTLPAEAPMPAPLEHSITPPKRSAREAELDDDTSIGNRATKKTKLRPSTNNRVRKTQPAQTKANVDATTSTKKTDKGKNQPHTRNKGTIKNRGEIEMFGHALTVVIKKSEDSKDRQESIPDYSALCSDPEEHVIIDNVFNKGTDTKTAAAKYNNVKRRCLFAAALLYERNLTRAQLSNQDAGDKRLHEINTTRMQPAGLVDVNSIRPMFRAYRPVQDQTFCVKKTDQNEPDNELAFAGKLAHLGWFPPMVEKTGSTSKVINDHWYEQLGTKEERQKWLAMVEVEKAKLEEKAAKVGKGKEAKKNEKTKA